VPERSARAWMFVWIPGNRRVNVHAFRECCKLSITIGPVGFRWFR